MLEELRINERMKDPQEREAADLVMHEETKRKKGSSSVSARTYSCLLYTSPSPRDRQKSRMPSSA